MKPMTFIIALALAIGIVYFFKINNKDVAARKDAKPVMATVTKLRCEQRLKGDKSLVTLSYQGKNYSIFTTEKKCSLMKLNTETKAFYSNKYDKLFIEL